MKIHMVSLLHRATINNQTELHVCLVCWLAVITPPVLSTVSGCYLTGVQIKKFATRGFVMCSLVTS